MGVTEIGTGGTGIRPSDPGGGSAGAAVPGAERRPGPFPVAGTGSLANEDEAMMGVS